jgi:Spy/CpxP family protein refolding chaperone
MNAGLKWKLIAGFLLVFVAGGVTGAFLAATTARHFLSGPPGHGLVAEHMRERLRSELKLTPEQMTQIAPTIDKAGAQIEEIRTDTARRVHGAFAEAHHEIAKNLTDDQKARLEQMRQRHQRWLHHSREGDGSGVNSPPPQ